MIKKQLIEQLNDECSLALNVSSWQKLDESLLRDLQRVLRDSGEKEEFEIVIPEWFSSRSQKHSALLDISSLSGLSMDRLESLQTMPLVDLYQIVVVLHARDLMETNPEDVDEAEDAFNTGRTLDSMRAEHEVLIQKIQTISDLEVENSISAAVLLSSFGLEDVYFALFQEMDGELRLREELARPELWLLEAFNADVFSEKHQIALWYSSGRFDKTLLDAFSSYSSDELQKASSLVRKFLLRQVVCPAGEFWMGNEDTDSVRHRVHLNTPISVCVFIVTNALYRLVSDCDGDEGASHPVVKKSWYEAIQFCNDLSTLEGLQPYYRIYEKDVAVVDGSKGYRLLTEAEWEYVAKAGTELSFSGSLDAHDVAWFKGNASEIQRVAQKKANDFGIYDMSGNVFEWVWDAYAPYIKEEMTNPRVDFPEGLRVVRGGSVDDVRDFARVSCRLPTPPKVRSATISWRVGRTI